MSRLTRGALLEYGANLIGPIPNLVIFQFNPETLTRTLSIPAAPAEANPREQDQAGDDTWESIAFTAHFDASDDLGDEGELARTFGVGPQLAALELMAHPTDALESALGAVLDAVGQALGVAGAGGGDPAQAIPRQVRPRLLFIWGDTRIVPVSLRSLRITEQSYDPRLNPIRAAVDMELRVTPPSPCSDDWLGRGAMEFSTVAREVQAVANLANTADQVVDLIPF